jgi:hypothetical protein
MTDAARAKAWQDFYDIRRYEPDREEDAFKAGWNAAAEQTATLQAEIDKWADSYITFTKAHDELVSLRAETAALRVLLQRIADAKDSQEWWADLDRTLNRLAPEGQG